MRTGARAVSESLQLYRGFRSNLISSSAISYHPAARNSKPARSSNIQLFTISCLPGICVFLVNVKITQPTSNSEVMIYAAFSSESGGARWFDLHDGERSSTESARRRTAAIFRSA